MPKNDTSAFDRLRSMMNSSDNDESTSSISSDDYLHDIEGDILSKLSDDESDSTIEEVTVPNNAQFMRPKTEIKPTAPAPKPIEKFEQIPIDVTDTGEDMPLESPESIINSNENVNSSSNEEELFINNTTVDNPTKPEGKRRGRRKKHESVVPEGVEESTVVANDPERNPLYDQLVINMVNELKRQRFKFSGFNDESMNMLFEYIQTKF